MPLVKLPVLAGCALAKPYPPSISTADRLQMFPTAGLPLKGDAEIYRNKYQIPFIHSADDSDTPFLLGIAARTFAIGPDGAAAKGFPGAPGGDVRVMGGPGPGC